MNQGDNVWARWARAEDEARAALRTMGARLLALSEKTSGELAVEARRALLLARMPLDKAEQIDRALELAGSVVGFVDNWSDCARRGVEAPAQKSDRFGEASGVARGLAATAATEKRPAHVGLTLLAASHLLDERREELRAAEEPERDRSDREFDEGLLEPAQEAAQKAADALCAMADAWLAKLEGQ